MDYNAINAKVSGLFGRLMTYSDYESFSRMQNLDEIWNALQSNPAYSHIFETGLTQMRRGTIERKLLVSLYADYNRIYKFLSDVRLKKFLDAYFLKHEVQELKLLLCMVYDERDISQNFDSADMLFPKRTRTDIDKLRNAHNLAELIDALIGTEFYTVLSRVYHEGCSLFELESQLDLYYYRNLIECINKYLSNNDVKMMHEIVGSETDLRNISWIYRLKTYYHVDNDLIYAHLIPPIFRLTKNHLKELIVCDTLDEFTSAIRNGPYGHAFSQNENLDPDVICERELRRLFTSMRRRHMRSSAPVIAYMHFKEKEINNLTSLLECVSYGLAPREIMKFLYGGEAL